MKKPIAIHTLLFAVFPVLFLFSQNLEELLISDIIIPLLIILGITILMFILSRIGFKDSRKAGLFISLLLILFFSYGYFQDLIKSLPGIGFTLSKKRYIFLTYTILLAGIIYLTKRTKKNLNVFTNFLNIVSIALIAISIINIGYFSLTSKKAGKGRNKFTTVDDNTGVDTGRIGRLHDIYYIILDGYASTKTLQEVYGFNNHEFEEFLTGKGFYLATESRSNYSKTFLSLASSLNMEYINYLKDMVRGRSDDWRIAIQMIKDNKTVDYLRSKGYKYIHFKSGWGATDYNKHADVNIQCGRINEFLMILIQTTMLKPFEDYIISDDSRARILCTFSRLAEIPQKQGPKFVFAHIMAPHPPYVFGADGEAVRSSKVQMDGNVWEQMDDYLNQLVFINKQVKILIEQLLLRSEIPPVIILQADHGSASKSWGVGKKELLDSTILNERMGILNAYYLPDTTDECLYDHITPVNTFRLILNLYFDIKLDLLPDKSYFSLQGKPYEFVDVDDFVFNYP